MSTKPTADQILRDFEALGAGSDQLERRWDAARRERTLQLVLDQASANLPRPLPDRPSLRRRWLGAGIAAAMLAAAGFAAPVLLRNQPSIPAEPLAPASTAPSQPPPSQPAQPAGPPASSRWTDSPIELPYARYVEVLRQARRADLEAWHAKNEKPFAKQEKLLVQCMADSGFKYHARPLPLTPERELGRLSGAQLPIVHLDPNRDVVARHAYGQPQRDTTLVAAPGAGIELPLEEWSPADQANLAYYNDLDEEAQQSYDITLVVCGGDRRVQAEYPKIPTEHALTDPYISDSYHGGQTWFDEAGLIVTASYSGGIMGDQAEDPEALIEARGMYLDPRIVAVNESWISCMEQKAVVPEPVDLRTARHIGPLGVLMQQGLLEREGKALWPEGGLQAFALADYDCRVDTDYVNRYAQAQAAYQNEQIAAHQAELDNLVDTWNKKRQKR